MKQYLLGIDIGSGGCKAALLDIESKNSIIESKEYPTYYPRPGWAEQNPEDWLKNVSQLIKFLLGKEKCSPANIKAVGISGVTHSPVLLDRKGNVLGKVIHITDARSYREAKYLREKAGDIILNTGLNSVDVMWTISMLLWIKKNDTERWEKISKILFPKDYIRFKLTGTDITDVVDAQGSLLFDPVKKRWDKNLTELIGVDKKVLPKTANPQDIVGKVTSGGSFWSGLKEGTPVIAGTTDTLLEVFAAGSIKPGDCTVKLATFGRVCVITEKPYFGKGLVNYSYIVPNLWYPGTGTKSFGTSFRWFRDEFCRDIKNLEDAFLIMDREAKNIAPTSKGLIYHPYLQGEGSPYDDPHLRGSFIGLTLYHRRGHLIRAVLEGTAFSISDSIDFIKNKGVNINAPLKFIGGGVKSKLWTKILADVLGTCAVIPKATDPSVGAALLSGVGIGVYKNIEEAIKGPQIGIKIKPDVGKTKKYKELFKIYKKVKNLLTEINHTLSENFS